MRDARCARCERVLDPSIHATCDVCGGTRYCLDCGRTHYCTGECEARGCIKGLCVKVVRDGVMSGQYGIPGG